MLCSSSAQNTVGLITNRNDNDLWNAEAKIKALAGNLHALLVKKEVLENKGLGYWDLKQQLNRWRAVGKPWARAVCKKKRLANDMTLAVRCCEDINYDLAFSTTVTKAFFPADEKAASRRRRLSKLKICLLAVSLWYSRVMEKVCKLIKQEIENARLDIKKKWRRKNRHYCACVSKRSMMESEKLNSEDVGNWLWLTEVKIELINNDIILTKVSLF